MSTAKPTNAVKRVPLLEIAHARSGDKGNGCNIGLIARDSKFYPVLCKEVTADRVKDLLAEYCRGTVARYELPNLEALNFVLTDCLGGGGTVNLRTDSQGKLFGMLLLRMTVEI